MKNDVLAGRHFHDLNDAQRAFDQWRLIYHHERPHEAIQMKTPATRYRPGRIAYPERLPEVVYPDGDRILEVGWDGKVKLDGYRFKVSNALRTHRIAARAVEGADGVYELFFAHQRSGQIDLRNLTRQD